MLTLECGCVIRLDVSWNKERQSHVASNVLDFCPLHRDAAKFRASHDRLLEACKKLLCLSGERMVAEARAAIAAAPKYGPDPVPNQDTPV